MLAPQHIKFGEHSEIPRCCIDYFIHQWDYDIERFGSAQRRDPHGPEYVRCNPCLISNKRNKIHKCSYKCKEFLESIGRTDLADDLKKPKEDDLWMGMSPNFYENFNIVTSNESLNLATQRYWQAATLPTMAPVQWEASPTEMIYYDPVTPNRAMTYEEMQRAVADQRYIVQNPTITQQPPEQNLPSGAALRLTSEGSTSINDPFPLV